MRPHRDHRPGYRWSAMRHVSPGQEVTGAHLAGWLWATPAEDPGGIRRSKRWRLSERTRAYPPFGADHKASMTLAVLMQNQVICTPADSLPSTGRAV
jgi:hypothetical protein